MSITEGIARPITAPIARGLRAAFGGSADAYADLAWAAASSEYMVKGTGSHEFVAQYAGTGSPTFSTPAGLLLPDNTGTYVAIAEDTMPVHGARWDGGVPYTDDSGGTPLTVMPSLYAAPAQTNLALFSNDMTNAAWVKANMTAALDAPGITGSPNTGSTLTATAGNATAIQTVTSALGDKTGRFFLRRKTGTGTVEICADGVTWSAATLTADYQEFIVEANTTDPQVGVRIVTSGDEVEFGYCGCYASTADPVRGSAPIVTAGVTVTNIAISSQYDIANHSNVQGAYYCELQPIEATLGRTGPLNITLGPYTNGPLYIKATASTFKQARTYDGTNLPESPASDITGLGVVRVGSVYGDGSLSCALENNWSVDAPYDGAFTVGSYLALSRNAQYPFLQNNVQRWDLNYVDGKAKITELMT